MSDGWVIYDPETDQFVDIQVHHHGELGIETCTVDWVGKPVYYPHYDLFEFLVNLNNGQLRAIWNTQVVPSNSIILYDEGVALLDWYVDELKSRGITTNDKAFEHLKI